MSRIALWVLSFSLCARTATAGTPPKVAYQVQASAGSWQPLEPADLARAIEHAALEVLTKPGLMQLDAVPPAKKGQAVVRSGDYLLEIRGRLLDEAETHTVVLSFGPLEKSDLASFNASETVVLSKLARTAMLEKIDQSARKAAAQLLASLRPSLERVKQAKAGDPEGASTSVSGPLPWKWAEVRVPGRGFAASSADLSAKNPAHRQAALRELTSLALVEATPRNVLESCVLGHPDPATRLGCLKALRPMSRTLPPTQRVVTEAFRRDRDRDVVSEANEQMLYFTGLSRTEAAQAWLERAAAGEVIGPLEQLGDLPNLDLAAAQCLLSSGKRPKYQRGKSSCINLLKSIPSHQRRRAILWKHLQETEPDSPYYLEGAGEREGSNGTDWQWAAESLLETASRWDAELEEVLWRRYQRTLSESSMRFLSEYGAPSERLAQRLLEIVQTAGQHQPLWGLERFVEEDPKLAPQIKEKLAELIATGSFPKTLREQDLKEALQKIERAEKKAAAKNGEAP